MHSWDHSGWANVPPSGNAVVIFFCYHAAGLANGNGMWWCKP